MTLTHVPSRMESTFLQASASRPSQGGAGRRTGGYSDPTSPKGGGDEQWGSVDIASSRVLVTGASGFIGTRLVEELGRLGAQVHCAGRTASDRDTAASHLVDLTDQSELTRLVADLQPEVIFHLASAVTGSRDVELVSSITSANLLIAVNLMGAVVKHSPGARLVLAGSLEEHGSGPDGVPGSPYAAAKLAASTYAEMFSRLWGLRVAVLRIAMAYGPGQRDVTKLVPYVVRRFLDGESPRLTSGDRRVDWVYVDDVVDAFIRAAVSDHADGEVMDIGSGVQTSIREIVELLATMFPDCPAPEFGALTDRPMDFDRIADTGRARDLIGWTARTGLLNGLRSTVDWYSVGDD